MKRKLTVFLSAAAILFSNIPAFADDAARLNYSISGQYAATEKKASTTDKEIDTSITYKAYEQIAGYIADKYLNDSYTSEDIMKIGLSAYLEEKGDEVLVPLLKAALQSLDDYSDFYTRNEYVEYTNNLNKTFYGLGIVMKQSGEYVEIDDFVEENSLAQKSGFKIGDKIVKVNGIDVIGNSITEVRNLVIGELGTTVLITVLRDGREIDITGTRTAVNNSTVSGGILKGNIGYIKIASFSSNAAKEFNEVAAEMKKSGVRKLILDLRNNPGGVVSAAVDIAKTIVPLGKIVDVKYRDEKMNHTYYSELSAVPFTMAVLINENTASSAEILASAIQDSKAGILIGEQTFGKAVIQSTYPLNNGMVFKLTIGQYLTRNGNEIDHIGLSPDKHVINYTKRIDTTGYTKFDFLTPSSVGSSGINVTAAKERLAMMNLFIGNLSNDVFNTDLVDALKEFQRKYGLTDSGVLDVPTQIKLKEIFESLETTVDLQMQEAYTYFGGNTEDLYSE